MTPRQREIIEAVASEHRLTLDVLLSRRTEQSIARPRQEAMHRLRATGMWSTTQIGAIFDRDHTTVMHATRRHEERLQAAAAEAAINHHRSIRLGDTAVVVDGVRK